MKFITNFSQKLNKTQRSIFGIAFGLIFLIFTLAIADAWGGYGGPFDFEYTWIYWTFFVLIVGYFEYKLFS